MLLLMKWNLLKEMMIIGAIYASGEMLAWVMNWDYFGGLIGLFLLLIALHTQYIKVDDIRQISTFFLGHMPFFFIPAGVSVMANYYLLEGFIWQITLLIMFSTLIVMAVSGLVVEKMVSDKGV